MINQGPAVNATLLTMSHLTTAGVYWLWAVFTLISIAAIGIALVSLRVHPRERVLHLFNVAILTTAAIAYFCMASDLGYARVAVLHGKPSLRPVWFVRYIDWMLTTPLLLAELLLSAGLPMTVILSSVFADEVMIVTGLLGGLVPSASRWVFYAFGCVAMFWVFWNIISGMSSAEKLGGAKARRTYGILSGYLIILWLLYPVVWALSEGSNTISVTSEMVLYGILDILAKPVYAIVILIVHRNTSMSQWGLGTESRLERIEKQHEEKTTETATILPMNPVNYGTD